jgi:hypothetical protein
MSEALLRSKPFELRRLVRRLVKIRDDSKQAQKACRYSEKRAVLQEELISCIHAIALSIIHDEDALSLLKGEANLAQATALELLEHLVTHPKGLREGEVGPLVRPTFLAAVRCVQIGELHDYIFSHFTLPHPELMIEQGKISFSFEGKPD